MLGKYIEELSVGDIWWKEERYEEEIMNQEHVRPLGEPGSFGRLEDSSAQVCIVTEVLKDLIFGGPRGVRAVF